MMRLQTYAGISLIATLAVVYHAFNSRGQFYPAMVYLSTSKISLVLLLNMGLVIMCILWQLTKRLFLGSLREAEVERLNEQSWREVMEILFAITIFRQDFSVTFLAMVTALLLIKALHWLAQKRVEYIETTPSVPMLSHIRIVSFMGFLLLLDGLFLYNNVKFLIETKQASVSLFFSFEYMILATTTVSTFVKYVFYVSDMLMEGQWERKPIYTFYLELIRDLLHLSMYLCFFLVIFMNYGVPLHLIRELYETFRNFKIRVADYIRYRKITSNMNDRFPDATTEELNAALVVPPENGTNTAAGHRSRSDVNQQGTGTASTSAQGSDGSSTSVGHLSQHQKRLQAAAAAASIYERSYVYPSANTLVWRVWAWVASDLVLAIPRCMMVALSVDKSPGYAVVPQAQGTLADPANREPNGEPSSVGQSQQQFAISGGPANLSVPQFPHCVFVPFQAPAINATYGERFGSNPNIPDTQLDTQKKFLRHQIVFLLLMQVLQNQLQLLEKPEVGENTYTSPPTSSDSKGKSVGSTSASASVPDCGRHGEIEQADS
ncbi:E3 ubiquitin-protein ligase synoviolin [Morella rubra]|uniref:E3 ubiquitin-protein ligase synoviolin n=1 Tax=Morella rubra TaxID=262757 RepID=A0A6A1UYW8_9ROSI|nr:E3 ubiquitin-protein ligase synoviolin [Morella rubra]